MWCSTKGRPALTVESKNWQATDVDQPTVAEVLPDGHERLTSDQLRYIAEMANRVGFDVLAGRSAEAHDKARIKLRIRMDNPVFRVQFALPPRIKAAF